MTRALKRFLIKASLGKINSEKNSSRSVLLEKQETHHLKNVLRLSEGSKCLIFDCDGNEYMSEIDAFLENGQCLVKLNEQVAERRRDFIELTVAQAIPQHRKMDLIVEKAAELGVYALIPVMTDRTIVRVSKEKRDKVVRRWQRIAEQTVKQSRQSIVPKVEEIRKLEDLWSGRYAFDETFIFDPDAKAIPMKERLLSLSLVESKQLSRGKYLLIIGPEGGFSLKEIENAKSKGANVVSMGGGILKTDTAFVVAVAMFSMLGK